MSVMGKQSPKLKRSFVTNYVMEKDKIRLKVSGAGGCLEGG